MTIDVLKIAIQQKVADWIGDDIASAQDINTGWCADFTMSVIDMLNDPRITVDGIYDESDLKNFGVSSRHLIKAASVDLLGHTFIVKEGRYYDAEAPAGVSHPLLLPIFSRALQEGRELNLINEYTYRESLAYIANLSVDSNTQSHHNEVNMTQLVDVTISASFQVIDTSGRTVEISDKINSTVDIQHWMSECSGALKDYCETKQWLKDKQLLNSIMVDVVALTEDGRYVHLMKEGYPDMPAAKSLERPSLDGSDPLTDNKTERNMQAKMG